VNRRPVLAGVVLVALGVVLLLDELGSLDAGDLIATWWPLTVIGAGVVQMTVRPRSVGGGAVVLSVGVVLQLWRLEVIDDLSLLWPVLLLTLGGWLLLGRRSRRPEPELLGAPGVEVGGAGEELDIVTVFSDRRVRLAPGTFRGGSVVTVFGDVDLDLAAAVPASRAKLDGVTIFGDVDLFVPASWEVTSAGTTILGDVRIDERVPVAGDGDPPTLRLDLVTIFGDIRVRRVPVGATSTV
jgi:hypothetical protein